MPGKASRTARFWALAFLLVVLVWLVLFASASAGVRGSDQYWYVAEVRSVMAGDPRTNSLWPHFLLSDPGYVEARPFIHQGMMPYVVGGLGGLGPYAAWIVFNLLATLFTAALIVVTLRQLKVDTRLACLATALFLLLPITLWHATQPLVETAVALLSAAMMAVAVGRVNSLLKFTLLIGLAAIGQQIVTIFQPVLLAILAGFLWAEWFGDGGRSLRRTLYYLVVAGLGLLLVSLKESTLGFSLAQLAMNGTAAGTNMDLWLQDGSLPFSPGLLAGKIWKNFAAFLAINSNQIFFLPFLGLTALILVGFAAKWRSRPSGPARKDILLPGYIFLVAMAVYAIVITLHQNQARYILYVLPILIVTATWLYQRPIESMMARRAWIFAVAGLPLLAICALLAFTLRAESAAAARGIAEVRQMVAETPALRGAPAVIECYRGGESLQLAYALPDKLFVHVEPSLAGPQLARIAAASGARLLLCPQESTSAIRAGAPGVTLTPIAMLGSGDGALELSRLD